MTFRAQDISVTLGTRAVLRAATISIAPGEIVCVLGPNGTGKSTLLRALAGSLQPERGEVTLGDVPLRRHKASALAMRRAVMSQETQVAYDFTGLEIARLGRTPHASNESSATSTSIALAAMEFVGAAQFAHRSIRTLSGGERQRVHLARALAQIWNPAPPAIHTPDHERFLLLDEPVSALDVRWQHDILSLLRKLARRGIGVLAILHDLNLAALYSDRIAFLHEGRVASEGPPGEVVTPEIIHRLYGVCTTVCRHPTAPCPLVIHTGHAHAPPGLALSSTTPP